MTFDRNNFVSQVSHQHTQLGKSCFCKKQFMQKNLFRPSNNLISLTACTTLLLIHLQTLALLTPCASDMTLLNQCNAMPICIFVDNAWDRSVGWRSMGPTSTQRWSIRTEVIQKRLLNSYNKWNTEFILGLNRLRRIWIISSFPLSDEELH